ncbi:hypothetical protein ABZ816_25475 [Actinosynnema sp. NPDC047251]|uniref:Guanylate cyclase domain-containing protein n=1 Tax=Saccharothrix espanaensis (strain ATCC 51144 / DSM 44229 / JCM 9112 / NBRC 15066 / NRRL 15764) TaxID=1179773 RepID=K0K2F2_SACES|nr:hypothetical protein [Saccharothrix espanaensis]CCH31757.1 hypothetical protein BN6_44770 [Saccharothrix espanaensis DSM 44229]
MTDVPRDLTAPVDARVLRFRDRDTVPAGGPEALLAGGVDPTTLLRMRTRLCSVECLLLSRLVEEHVVAHQVVVEPTVWVPRQVTAADLVLPTQARRSVAPAAGDDPSSPGRRARRPLRMGFVVDVVGYGARTARLRALAQRRVSELNSAVLEHLGVDLRDVDHQGTGDGVLVFLPPHVDVPWTVPRLLRGWWDLLHEDNELYTDRLRLRMAVALGPVAPGPLGFVGPPATTAGRLLDSEVLRAALAEEQATDLAVLVSDAVHSFAVDPADPAFTRRPVGVKDYRADGWLWVG